MPSLRWSGGTNSSEAASLTTRPPIVMVPVSFCSSPATMRSVVVLPQPDGPSRVTNSPCSTARSTESTAFSAPKRRPTARRVTLGTALLLVDLFGERQHLVLPGRIGRAHRLGGEQWPDLLDRLFDHPPD